MLYKTKIICDCGYELGKITECSQQALRCIKCGHTVMFENPRIFDKQNRSKMGEIYLG